jgi:dynein heavy chain
MNYFFAKFNEEVRQIIPQLIQTVLYVYNTVRLEMLPTPSKSHYTFNLRDISKVF